MYMIPETMTNWSVVRIGRSASGMGCAPIAAQIALVDLTSISAIWLCACAIAADPHHLDPGLVRQLARQGAEKRFAQRIDAEQAGANRGRLRRLRRAATANRRHCCAARSISRRRPKLLFQLSSFSSRSASLRVATFAVALGREKKEQIGGLRFQFVADECERRFIGPARVEQLNRAVVAERNLLPAIEPGQRLARRGFACALCENRAANSSSGIGCEPVKTNRGGRC